MIAEINAVIQSTKALNDLFKATRELRNANEFAAAINEVMTKLTQMIGVAAEAREKQLALTDEVHELKKEKMETEDWKREEQRYLLTEIAGGVLAQRLKPGMEQGEAPHDLCAHCFGNHKKEPIQAGPRLGNISTLRCIGCNATFFPTGPKRQPRPLDTKDDAQPEDGRLKY